MKIVKYVSVFAILIIMIIISMYHYSNHYISGYKTIDVDTAEDFLETGDLVLFKWNIEYLLDVKIQIKTPFSHCAMIIEIDGEKYIMEKMDLKDYEAFGNIDHQQLIKFKDRVNKYNGKVYCIKRKNKMTQKEKSKLYNKFNEYMNIQFRDNYVNHIVWNCMFKRNTNNAIDLNNMYCAEYLSYLLSDIGSIINPHKKHSCMTPYDIYNFHIFDKSQYYRIK